MNLFTPTTNHVRDAYSYDPEYEYRHPDDPGYHYANRAAFDRWLQSIKETAWAEGWNGARIHGVRRSENPYKSK